MLAGPKTPPPRTWAAPSLPRGVLWALAALLAALLAASVAGFALSLARSFADGQHGNQFTAVWVCAFGGVMAVQAAFVWFKPRVVTARTARFWAWAAFAATMLCYAIVLIISLAIALPGQFGWVFLWVGASALLLLGAMHQRRHPRAAAAAAAHGGASTPAVAAAGCSASSLSAPALQQVVVEACRDGSDSCRAATAADGAAAGKVRRRGGCCACCGGRRANGAPPPPRPCSGAAWGRCCSGFGFCLGWSSMFFLLLLGFFMVLQVSSCLCALGVRGCCWAGVQMAAAPLCCPHPWSHCMGMCACMMSAAIIFPPDAKPLGHEPCMRHGPCAVNKSCATNPP